MVEWVPPSGAWGMPLTLSLLQNSENTAQFSLLKKRASLVAQVVKNPPAMQETWVRSLGREDPLEKKMATHSSILAWKNPMDGGAW